MIQKTITNLLLCLKITKILMNNINYKKKNLIDCLVVGKGVLLNLLRQKKGNLRLLSIIDMKLTVANLFLI